MDQAVILEGETGFVGFASRVNPRLLGPGMLQLSQNGRIDRGEWQTRKGADRLASGISTTDAPIILPFTLAPDVAVSSLTRSGATVTATTSAAHGYATARRIEIRGAVETDYNGDFTITVTGASTFTYTILGTPTSPATGTILANGGPVLRESYAGGLQTAGVFRNPRFEANREWIVLVGGDSVYLWAQGQSLILKSYPAGEDVTGDDTVSVVQAFDQLLLLRSRPLTGDYAPKAVTSIAQTSGTATITMTAAHGWTTGFRVRIEGAGQAGYLHEFDITVTGASTFTVSVPAGTVSPATGTMTARRVQKPLVWTGETSTNFVSTVAGVPSVGPTYNALWSTHLACYHNNQLVTAPTPVRDTVQVSQVLDYNVYDPLFKSFRANAGSDDSIVALHSFAERQVLIFGSKSIYRAVIDLNAAGDSFNPATSVVELVTSEIGCAARHTVVTAGQFVYFLSASGVYRLDSSFEDLKVRGRTMPLSDPVQDQLADITGSAIQTSLGVYHDNRYYLAIPTGGATGPNRVLIYSFLNEAWESVDTYPFEITSLQVSQYDGVRRLFAVTRAGSLYLLEQRADGDVPPLSDAPLPVAGLLRTRRYQGPRPGKKRWLRASASIILPAGAGQAGLKAVTQNPDVDLDLGTVTQASGGEEDYEVKRPMRLRAHEVSLEIDTRAGRPTVRGLTVDVVSNAPGDGRTRDSN